MDEKIEMTPEMEYFSAKLKTLPYDYTVKTLTRTGRNQTGLKIKKLITKARKYEDTKA